MFQIHDTSIYLVTYTTFLDVKYLFSNSGCLITDINIKPTDVRVYLHYSSFHPRQTSPSIVYGQGLRYRRIINDNIIGCN